MTKDTLQILRITAPGIAIILLGVPLVQGLASINTVWTFLQNFSLSSLVYFIPVLAVGAVYEMLDFRGSVLERAWSDINANLKNQIIAPFSGGAAIRHFPGKLLDERALMNIFYDFLDNHESLKEKAKDVYLNGLRLSILADIIIVGRFWAFVSMGTFFVREVPFCFYYAIALAVAVFWSRSLLERTIQRHKDLGNDQVDFIWTNYHDDIEKRLSALVNVK